MPEKFSLIICDGPTRHERGRRYGLFPMMNQWFSPGCIILFDDIDIDTEHEQGGLDYWLKKLNVKVEIKHEKRGSSRPFFIITMPNTR